MSTIQISKADYTLAQGTTLTVTNETAFIFQAVDTNDGGWLTIAGDLRVVTTQPPTSPGYVHAVNVGYSSFYGLSRLTITPSGSIRVDTTATSDVAYGTNAGSWTPRIINDGLVEVAARTTAYGIWNWGAINDDVPAITNNGTVRVTSQGNAYGVSMGAGEWLQNNGLIDVFGVDKAVGVSFSQWNSSFRNTGVIRAHDASPIVDSVAVLFGSNVKGFFYNAGTLEGDFALKVVSYYSGGNDVFQNAGKMVGAVQLGNGNEALLNSGLVTGYVNFGTGNDFYDGREGRADGLVSGQEGEDTLVGGAGFDNLQGNTGNDSQSGGGGDDFVVGGRDDDTLFGDAGDDIVYGNLGADTCEGDDGADIVRGGQGNDVVRGDAGDDFLSGDKGDDTVAGGSGADIFHTFGDAGVDRVLDFNLAQGDRVHVDPGTQYTVSQMGADTVINMTSGGQMTLVNVQMSSLTGSWIFGA
ncbi:MAG: hypothetical protein JHD15_22295 [Phenylobacterium sp.]|uniref:calcium-binding protein n=1 Tax=Phenylobacterium sp. TaxID=1871053 RepID=UPI001A2F72B2|nr:calcium-binding protein [Phenylobacterium sp.]MBJ7413068.1 hypothetical protein [Phenylobacterium sp.]